MEYDIPYPTYIPYIGPNNAPLGVKCQGRVVTCFNAGPGGARSACRRPARHGGQREGLPRRGRSPGRRGPELSGSPHATPGDAPGRERRSPGTRGPRGGPLWVLDGLAHVQPVRPAPVNGQRATADGRGAGHLPPQQRPGPAARPEDAPFDGRGPVPEPGTGTYPGGVSELDAALHLLHLPDEDLEVVEVTISVAGAGETPLRPRPRNLVKDGTRQTPPRAVVCNAFSRDPTEADSYPN